SHFIKGDWAAKGKITGQLKKNAVFKFALSALHDGKKLKYSLDGNYDKGTIKSFLNIAGKYSSDLVEAVINGKIENPTSGVPKIMMSDCRISLKKKSFRSSLGKASLSCPLDLFLKTIKMPKGAELFYDAPDQLRVQLTADADMPFLPNENSSISGNAKINLKPISGKLISNRGETNVIFEGVLSGFPDTWKINANVDIDFAIENYSKLVRFLVSTPYSIPAPLNSLDGRVSLKVKGAFDFPLSFSHLPIEIQTRLGSEHQKLNIDGRGYADLHMKDMEITKIDVVADVELTEVQLQLPNLSPVAIPQLFPDPRIKLAEGPKQKKEKAFQLNYKASLKTNKGKPLILLSNLAKTPVPIAIDVAAENGKFSGSVNVQQFSIDLFRRKAKLERLNLKLEDPINLSDVNGLASVKYADYTVNIGVEGPVKHPAVILSSNPPMSQEDIISTLIYGEPYSNLDKTDAESVGGMNDAFANRALALTSMYLFASTPIQRIGYNPDTKTVSAKLKIADGTSLTIATDGESKGEVGLRRRLGNGWIINTTVESPTDDVDTKGSAFLEWHKRH
ncbi:MAG: translocation/assembly module TamB domain-containing protein, partial [Pseudomonadota bacterium]